MKRSLLTIIAWSTLNGFVSAHSSLTFEVSRIDGLPARILPTTGIRPDLLPGNESFDLIPAFKEMGLNIVEGETALYHAVFDKPSSVGGNP